MPPPYMVSITSNLRYGPTATHVLDVYTPNGAPVPRVGIINIHGGGWQTGDKADTGTTVDAANLASGTLGCTVFSINYRLVQNGDVNTLPNPDVVNPAPAALADAQLAVRWIRNKASIYQLNTSKIFSVGFSAGAHIAAYLGVRSTVIPGTSVSSLLPGISPMVDGVAAHSTPADLSTAIYGPHNEDDDIAQIEFVNSEPIEANVADYNQWSPKALVTSSSKKMYLSQGSEDTTVMPPIASAMVNALVAAGVPATLSTYAGGHVFAGISKGQRNGIQTEAIKWLIKGGSY